jgi:hypothetical protein
MKRHAIIVYKALIGMTIAKHGSDKTTETNNLVKIETKPVVKTELDVFGAIKMFPLTKTCTENTGCHSCVLSSCSWLKGKFTGEPKKVTWEFWTKEAPKCEDNLGVCKKEV